MTRALWATGVRGSSELRLRASELGRDVASSTGEEELHFFDDDEEWQWGASHYDSWQFQPVKIVKRLEVWILQSFEHCHTPG